MVVLSSAVVAFLPFKCFFDCTVLYSGIGAASVLHISFRLSLSLF